MLASGFAGLGYQIVWTQQTALWLGHESAAVLAVVAAFFAGLGVGAMALGPRIEASRLPVLWYAGCELAIASWGLVLVLVMAPVGDWLVRFIGAEPTVTRQWAIGFAGILLLLFPATAAMGATLPAMERMTAASADVGSRSIASLYASNVLGAVLGVLALAFWLAPALGFARTVVVCVCLNLFCSATSLVAFRGSAVAMPPAQHEPRLVRRVLARLALTGLLGIGYEVLVVRVLSQVAEGTVYTFALLLAVYLVATAAGAAAYQRLLSARFDHGRLGDALLGLLASACLVSTLALWKADVLHAFVVDSLGGGMGAAVAAEVVLAGVAFGLPALAMGALFSELCARANKAGATFGRALGVNTLGAAAAPLVFGVIALPALGAKLALLSICLGYLALVSPRAWRRPVVWVPALGAVAVAVLAPRLAFVDVPEGGRLVSYREGVMAAVSIVEDAGGTARLHINNRQPEGSNATLRVDARQAWLPLLLHPAPERALFLGLGTGVTAAAAAEDPTLRVDAVELLPEVIAAAAYFQRPQTADAPRPRVVAADARRYVRASEARYDVIVSDNFHPARSGSGSLYTVEHFAAVRGRLAAGGVFCQWLPLHQLDLETLRSIVGSFLAVYPDAWAMLASYSLETPVLGLVARADGGHFDVAAVRERLAGATPSGRPAELGIEDELALLGSFVAGPAALREFAGDAPLNTDDRPVVAYRAPLVTYAPASLPVDRLLALLADVSIAPNELISAASHAASSDRLAAYWRARTRFIEAGRGVVPSTDVDVMLAQVREPLLEVLRVSPDFRAAYDPLLLMAVTLASLDVAAARALLEELATVQPARPEAAAALRELADARP